MIWDGSLINGKADQVLLGGCVVRIPPVLFVGVVQWYPGRNRVVLDLVRWFKSSLLHQRPIAQMRIELEEHCIFCRVGGSSPSRAIYGRYFKRRQGNQARDYPYFVGSLGKVLEVTWSHGRMVLYLQRR